ncbi:MAG: energy transducer TonB [Acidobacteriales bacterium]|nr:energy transducer TonB [Terriglobales bacterium]
MMMRDCPGCSGANPESALRAIAGSGDSRRVVGLELPSKPIRVSRLDPGTVLERVQPQYPAAAKLAHLEGEVVLRAIISRDGSIESIRPISGSRMLTGAAIDAVRRWRYRPYSLNGVPVEVETIITVNFKLNSASF